MLTSQLPGLIQTDIPELDLEAGTVDLSPKSETTEPESESKGPTPEGCAVSPGRTATLGWIALSIVAMSLARRRKAQ